MHGCGVRDRGRGGRDCIYVFAFVSLSVHGCRLCVHVFEMYLHCVCTSLVNVAPSCVWVHRYVGGESARVHVHLLQISLTYLLAGTGPLLKDFAVHLKHSRLRKVTFDWCALTSVDVATLLAEGLSENRTLEQLQINDSSSSTQVSL